MAGAPPGRGVRGAVPTALLTRIPTENNPKGIGLENVQTKGVPYDVR